MGCMWLVVVEERCIVFFFFQAEDGIRDLTVTGVQTCALPISVGALNPGDLPPVLDLEEAIPKSSASKRDAWEDVPADQRPSIIRNWLDAVEQDRKSVV